MSIIDFDLLTARAQLRDKKISAVELAAAYLERAEQHNKKLNAYITLTKDKALAQAAECDKNGAENPKANGALRGIPLAIKDNYCSNGVLTTAASRILGNFVPPYESFVTQKTWDAGGVMLGKTNMDEFAMGSTTMSGAFGGATNPWSAKQENANDKKNQAALVAGGSSGGSAVAVAAGLSLAALGSDTGGSVRQPAAFCGCVGVKPTFGRCSRYGIIAFASSLDQAGVFARNVADAAAVLETIIGFDPKDSTCVNKPIPKLLAATKAPRKWRVGVAREYLDLVRESAIKEHYERVLKNLEQEGWEIKDVSLSLIEEALATYYVIAPAEASSNLARYDGVRFGRRADDYNNLEELYRLSRSEGFGEEVKRRILVGTYVLSQGYYDAYYLRAQKVRRLVARNFAEAFEDVDVILTPTTPTVAFPQTHVPSNVLEVYHNDIFTVPASLAGLPGISVPVGLNEKGLPVGLQLLAPSFEEERLMNAAAQVEKVSGYKFRISPAYANADSGAQASEARDQRDQRKRRQAA